MSSVYGRLRIAVLRQWSFAVGRGNRSGSCAFCCSRGDRVRSVARFFFHIRMNDGLQIRDEEGLQLSDLEQAREEASRLVRAIVAELASAGDPVDDLRAVDV